MPLKAIILPCYIRTKMIKKYNQLLNTTTPHCPCSGMLVLPLLHVPTFAVAEWQSPGTGVWRHSSTFPTVVLTTKLHQHQAGIPIIFSALCTHQKNTAWSFIPFVVEEYGHTCNADTSQLTYSFIPPVQLFPPHANPILSQPLKTLQC